MVKVGIEEIIYAIQNGNFLWFIIPIFFVGVITDKYQEEFTTSIGNAISNGALIIFTGFSWLQIISSRINFPIEALISQYIFALFIIFYGLAIISSGFKTGEFARKYGRIRVVTFMLVFFTIMIYVPILYNFVSVLLFVFLFPFYYAFITELVKVLPNAKGTSTATKTRISKDSPHGFIQIGKLKLKEYLE